MLIDAGVFAARLIVGGVLLVAGLAKIRSGPTRFLQAIVGYDLLPRPLAALMASALPWLEVLVGGLLLLGWWTPLAALLGAGLLLVFAGAVAISLLRGAVCRFVCNFVGAALRPAPTGRITQFSAYGLAWKAPGVRLLPFFDARAMATGLSQCWVDGAAGASLRL